MLTKRFCLGNENYGKRGRKVNPRWLNTCITVVELTAATQGQPYTSKPNCWHWATAAGLQAFKPRQGAGRMEEL